MYNFLAFQFHKFGPCTKFAKLNWCKVNLFNSTSTKEIKRRNQVPGNFLISENFGNSALNKRMEKRIRLVNFEAFEENKVDHTESHLCSN